MKILAYSANHDGAAVLLENDCLSYSLEAEKDSGKRYAQLGVSTLLRSFEFTAPPDVIAFDCLPKTGTAWFAERVVDHETLERYQLETRYPDETPEAKTDCEVLFGGRRVRRFSSSHVRSHIMCAYGLSPFPQGQPCYVLIWEGGIGALYHVDAEVRIKKIGDILFAPGARYMALYGLADPRLGILDFSWRQRREDAGKLMALAAYGRGGATTPEQEELIHSLMTLDFIQLHTHHQTPKSVLSKTKFCNIGLESQDFKDLARQFSTALFNYFYEFVQANVTAKSPLLIAGGCGLNCEWNTRWRQCGLFTDVFVPPCANDSGIAIGAAIDALHHYTGNAKIDWSVYAGDPFDMDVKESPGFERMTLNLPDICRRLIAGEVIGWVQGRYEIGPRALGNRSLLAEPFSVATRDRLNRIKQREPFRPIAPICLEEDFSQHFDDTRPSPYMLHFQRVRSPSLAAVTHVDGTARAQSVNDEDNRPICDLLREFRSRSGVSVLCNTSLNFKGRGFVNRMSHLFALARDRGIDGLVVGTQFWRRRAQA